MQQQELVNRNLYQNFVVISLVRRFVLYIIIAHEMILKDDRDTIYIRIRRCSMVSLSDRSSEWCCCRYYGRSCYCSFSSYNILYLSSMVLLSGLTVVALQFHMVTRELSY